jgi:hypothetical protein
LGYPTFLSKSIQFYWTEYPLISMSNEIQSNWIQQNFVQYSLYRLVLPSQSASQRIHRPQEPAVISPGLPRASSRRNSAQAHRPCLCTSAWRHNRSQQLPPAQSLWSMDPLSAARLSWLPTATVVSGESVTHI